MTPRLLCSRLLLRLLLGMVMAVAAIVMAKEEERWEKDMSEEIYIEASTEGFELVSL
jgi:hypothetical protein